MRYIIVLALFLSLVSCATSKKNVPSETNSIVASGPIDLLTKGDAQNRSSSVTGTTYTLSIDLNETSKFYTGDIKIKFDNKEVTRDLRVDFKDGQISKLMVNGTAVPEFKQNPQAFYIPKGNLKVGANEVSLSFQHDFSVAGIGLHRFQDPKDKKVYVYTQFEPNDAARFIPCFDQPDMKAKFEMTVLAPSSWTLVSTTRETGISSSGKQKKWIFPQTKQISTYLFSLHGGPYKVWESKAGTIPLRLFARKSLAPYVNAKEWFTFTQQGLGFYQKYFNTPYPFAKYDQLIVPEFNYGAMENVAAVTFSERFVNRGKSTRIERSHTTGVILHEMAHMWFGDLVTMKWWDDLWLNESFATFMAIQAMVNATEFKEAWQIFYNDKTWAYYTDQLSTTHPIEAQINTADEAFNNFDGITYGKGAAVLKQLSYLMGAENFRKGLENYFKKYSYQNTNLSDFISSLQQETRQDLNAWANTWLKTQGVDTVKSEFTCNGDKFENLKLSIVSATPATPRVHAFEVAFLKMKEGKLESYYKTEIKTDKNGSPVLHIASGISCPDAVFTNYNDYGYFKSELDLASVKALKKNLTSITDPMMRRMAWDGLWQMVRDQKIPLQDYQDIIATHLTKEKAPETLERVLRTVSGGGYSDYNSLYYFLPAKEHTEYVPQVEDLYYAQLSKAKGGTDDQQLWMDSYITAAESKKAMDNLTSWLEGKMKLNGLAPNQDRRWKAINKLCRFGDSRAMILVNAEKAKDGSERGKNAVISCQAAFPDMTGKKKWWDTITAPKTEYSFSEIGAAIRSFGYPEQKDSFTVPFAGDYFKFLSKDIKARDEHYQAAFSSFMGPHDCTAAQRQNYIGFLKNNGNGSPIIVKELKEVVDEDQRCEKIRALALASATKKH